MPYTLTRPSLMLWQRSVRKMVSSLLDSENPNIRIANKTQVARFERTQKALDGPNLDDIYFDFDGDSPFTVWNRRIALLLAKRYIGEDGSFSKDVQVVQKSFIQRLRKLYAVYKESLVDLSPTQLDRKNEKQRSARRNSRQYYVSELTFIWPPRRLIKNFSNATGVNKPLKQCQKEYLQ